MINRVEKLGLCLVTNNKNEKNEKGILLISGYLLLFEQGGKKKPPDCLE